MQKIGFIGVGVMGRSMVRNLMKKGYEVSIYARTKQKVEDVLADGALWCDTIAQCTGGKDAVITIVGFPQDVEDVYFGAGGILDAVEPGTTLIDMTTTSPALDQRIYDAAHAKGVFMLDAPVTGGDVGAKNGTLTILVGGDRPSFDACLPVLSAMGTNVFYMGASGSGQQTKLANQVAIAGTVAGVCEAIAYAESIGLDPARTLHAISGGAAASAQMSSNGTRIMQDDFAPGFFIKHYIKDMLLAKEELAARGVSLSVLDTVCGMYQQLQERGLENDGTQALIKYYR